MLGTGALAYTLGLRHAVDAVIVAATANAVSNGVDNFSQIGGIIGTSISIAFLTLIAILNLIVLVGVIKTLRQVKREGVYTELDIQEYLNSRGLLGRFFRPVFRFVNASWKMYPLGLLFGIGFDTSTEITLLGITAIQGMSLIDSLDGMLMLFTYTWAYINPVRKLYYNFTITTISVVVAILVALIEFFSLIGEQLHLENGWWQFWYTLSDSFEYIGIVIVGAFIVTWAVSAIVYRLLGYKALEREFDKHKPEESVAVEEGQVEEKQPKDASNITVKQLDHLVV
ncbi:hypothetical protein DFQ28_002281 [Apophysomyces sp. BC1034]|nr:hypothetical protein DFQ28_002281 [Apophysomyces sp. BC1034]